MKDLVIAQVVELPQGKSGATRLRLLSEAGTTVEVEVAAHMDAGAHASVQVGGWVLCRPFGFVDGKAIYEVVSPAETPAGRGSEGARAPAKRAT